LADTITVKHDNGIIALLLGGLIVWLWFHYRKDKNAAAAAAASQVATNGSNASCGAVGTTNEIVPATEPANAQETDSGRFINGISPAYN
jgi:hypothetical protein